MRSYRKFCQQLLVVSPLFLCSLVFAGDLPSTADLRQGAIRALTQRLESDHYAPRKIDDVYSADVYNKFLSDLDKDRNIFLASDLARFERYRSVIDDEMHGHSTAFFDTVLHVYHQRVQEVIEVYHAVLKESMAFHSSRTIVEDRSTAAWPKDEAERREVWGDRVRLLVLKRLIEPSAGKLGALRKEDLRKSGPGASVKVGKWLDNIYKFGLTPEGEDQQFSLYLNAMMGCMDAHSTYFAPVDARTMNEQLSNHFYGLGLELSGAEGEVTIQSLLPGGSAFTSGLIKVGDKITAVSDKDDHLVDVSDVPIVEVTKMLRGEKGTRVRLQVERAGEGSKIVTLERAEVNQKDAAAKAFIIEKNGRKTGYISLPLFYVDVQNPQGAHCSADVYKLLVQLKEAGIHSLVMDLRNNPGGSLDEVAAMAALFINQGPLVQLKDKNNVAAYTKNDGNPAVYTGPMTVLVNGNSASASEIFAAAMQDYKRAVIIGSRTYGKGTAQESLAMGKVADKEHNRPAMNFGSIRLTIKKIYRVTGSSTQMKGVTPDLLLPDGNDYSYIREKNMPYALAWDTVPGTVFKPWDTVCDPAFLQRVHEQVGRDSVFTVIRENAEWLNVRRRGPFSLDPDKLVLEMKAMNDHVAGILGAVKAAPVEGVNVRAVAAADDKDEDPVKLNRWVGQLQSDIYIHEAIDVLNGMIKQ